MKATKVLNFISMYPDSANYFGISENLDLRFMFGIGDVTGQQPKGQYAWFWHSECPISCPDFVINVEGVQEKVYGYFLY